MPNRYVISVVLNGSEYWTTSTQMKGQGSNRDVSLQKDTEIATDRNGENVICRTRINSEILYYDNEKKKNVNDIFVLLNS